MRHLIFYQFVNNFLALLLCKIIVFDIFKMAHFFWFWLYREVLKFWSDQRKFKMDAPKCVKKRKLGEKKHPQKSMYKWVATERNEVESSPITPHA